MGEAASSSYTEIWADLRDEDLCLLGTAGGGFHPSWVPTFPGKTPVGLQPKGKRHTRDSGP